MYVRNARNREEVWLLDHIEAMGVDDAAFRSRDYVIAADEAGNEKTGFGRVRVHRTDDGEFCELTGIGVLEGWRGQGVGAHVIERLVDRAADEEFTPVYSLTDEPEYLEQFGFDRVATDDLPDKLAERLDVKREGSVPEAVPTRVDVGAFTMPSRLRERFKHAAEDSEDEEPAAEESSEDFGIDTENATYKYDTG